MWCRERKCKPSLPEIPATLVGVASTKQGKEGWATPEGQNAKSGPLKNTSLRCAIGLGSSLTREEAKLLANLYHGQSIPLSDEVLILPFQEFFKKTR